MSASLSGGAALNGSFQLTPAASGFLASGNVAITWPTRPPQFKIGASGSLADQCNLIYAATTLLTSGGTVTLDLTALTDPLGNAVNFARVRYLAIRVNSTTDGQSLAVGDSGTNEWDAFLSASAILTIPASTVSNDAFFLITSPNTTGFVVDATHKTLKIAASAGATFTVDIEIGGCSA